MSFDPSVCPLPGSVVSLPGPACSINAPAPNASFAQRISNCCNGATVHHIGNGTDEVPIEQSCVSWCTYPAFTGNYTQLQAGAAKWKDCLGVSQGAICQSGPGNTTSGSSSSGGGTGGASSSARLVGGRGAMKSVLGAVTVVLVLPLAVSVVAA